MVIVVRSDLKMSKGKIAAQVAHAAVSCAFASKKVDTKIFNKWYSEGQKKVVLKADSLDILYKIKNTADSAHLVNFMVTDAGRTEIPSGTITCIAIGPTENSALDAITGDLLML